MLKLSYQFIIKNKKKSLAVLFSIILSVALLTGVGAIIRSSNISKSEYYSNLNGNYQYSYSLNKNQYDKLEDVLKTAKAHIQNAGITVDLYTTDQPRVMTIKGYSMDYLKMNGISLLKGKLPTSSDEILLEEWMVSNLGLDEGVGEILECEGKQFQVVGVVSDSFEKYYNEIVAYTILEDTSEKDVQYKLYVNFELSGNIGKESKALMKELGCEEKDRQANWDVLKPLGINAPIESSNVILKQLNNFVTSENITIILFTIFSAFIIYSILNVSVMQRMSQYGILEALGTGFRQLFKIIFCELLLLFIVGFPIGCVLGICTAKMIYSKFSHIFLSTNVESASFVISTKIIGGGFICLLILLLFIAWWTVIQIDKKNSIESMHNNSRFQRDRRILAKKEKKLLQYVSHRYMTLKLRVFFSILFSLSIGGVLFCSTDYAVQEAKHENEMTMKADDGLNSDYLVNVETSSFNQGIPEGVVNKLNTINGISNINPVKHFLGATYISDEQYTNKSFFDDSNKDQRLQEYFNGICTKEANGDYMIKGNIYGYGDNMLKALQSYLIDGTIDSNVMEAENGVIVCLPQDGGTLQYDTIDLHPGDYINIKVPKSLEAEGDVLKFQSDNSMYDIKQVKIVATVKRVMAHNDYFVGPYGLDVIMTNSMMSRYFGIDNYNLISIVKESSVPGLEIANQIRDIVKQVERCNFIDYTSLIERENANLKQREIFFLGLSVIIILISMFHILNSISYLVLSRKQDFGILRAMGVSDGSFRKMLVREGGVYGIYASIVMVIATAIITFVMYVHLKDTNLLYEPKYILSWEYFAIWTIVNIALSTIAVLFSSRSILKETVVDCMTKVE